MKSMLKQKRYLVLALASVFILTSCGQDTSTQSEDSMSWETEATEESVNWEVPAAYDIQELNGLISSNNILTAYSEFARFNTKTVLIEPLTPFTDTGKPFTSPESCRESDAFIQQRTFVKNSSSSASDYMSEGVSWYWEGKDSSDHRRLIITIVGDSNTGESFLLNDIASELISCETVANQTSSLVWSTMQTFTQPTPETLRVDFKVFFAGSTPSVRKGLLVARQVGRNVIYVSYTRDGLGLPSDYPISSEIEAQMSLLLDDIALKLNS